jgi:hypothetical protein
MAFVHVAPESTLEENQVFDRAKASCQFAKTSPSCSASPCPNITTTHRHVVHVMVPAADDVYARVREDRMPKELKEALKRGRLTERQLKRLVEHEARELGLTYRQAVLRARSGKLPDTTVGTDLAMLVSILDAPKH